MDMILDSVVSSAITVFDAAGTMVPGLGPAARTLSYIQHASEQIRGNKVMGHDVPTSTMQTGGLTVVTPGRVSEAR